MARFLQRQHFTFPVCFIPGSLRPLSFCSGVPSLPSVALPGWKLSKAAAAILKFTRSLPPPTTRTAGCTKCIGRKQTPFLECKTTIKKKIKIFIWLLFCFVQLLKFFSHLLSSVFLITGRWAGCVHEDCQIRDSQIKGIKFFFFFFFGKRKLCAWI